MNFKKICKKIAEENGVTVSEVISDMQKAIDEGFLNPDTVVQAQWAKIRRKGERPTPEELITYLILSLMQ